MANDSGVQVVVEIKEGFVVLLLKASDALATQVILTAAEAEMIRALLKRGIDRLTPGAAPPGGN